MKALLIASFAMAALPLAAAETPQQQPATTTAATTAAAPAASTPAAAADSPLVKAAKASTKNKRKATITITNDTLVKRGGHITTTASQAPLPPVAPAPTEEQLRAEQKRKEVEAKAAAERAAAEKKAQERRQAAAERALEAQDGALADSLYDDPATSEHRAEQASQATTTSGDKKPPK